MKKLAIAILLALAPAAAAVPLAGCQSLPSAESVSGRLAQLERGVNTVSASIEFLAGAGVLEEPLLGKARRAIGKVQSALDHARAAIAALDRIRAEQLLNQAEADLDAIAGDVPAVGPDLERAMSSG